MFTLRRIALAPRVCGVVVRRPAMGTATAVSKPIMDCIQQQRPRRYSSSSSSKPSNPSDGARNASNNSTTTTDNIAQTSAIKRSGLKAVKAPSGAMKEGTRVPVVPSTDHLHPADVAISTFFAQHRPVSISHVVPLSCSETSFDSIFARRKLHPIHDSRLSSTAIDSDFKDLESAAESGGLDPVIRTAGNSGGSASHHQVNANSPIQLPAHLLQLSRKYIPFHPPPSPTPHTAFLRPIPIPTPRARVRARMPNVPQKMVQIVQVPAKDGTPMFTPNIMEMPYLDRAMDRERNLEESAVREKVEEPEGDKGTIQALSVKRLRKLKMKKHKLKKLRKRTRNLRRRIESHSR